MAEFAAGLDPAVTVATRDVLGRYLWALDRGDVDAVLGVFADDEPRFIDSRGQLFVGRDAIRATYAGLIAGPDFRGRQHIATYLFEEQQADQVTVVSYWMVVKWSFTENRKEIVAIGSSQDLLIPQPSGWRIKERRLGLLTDQHGPWVGVS